MFQYQHLKTVVLYCIGCSTFAEQTISYRSASSFTAESLTCIECGHAHSANDDQITYIRQKNERGSDYPGAEYYH
jgi:RNase P subunit RPR2